MAEPTEPQGANTQAIYGFFCGLIAVPTAFILIGILFGAMAIVLGRIGLQRSETEGRRGLSLAAIVLGAVGVVLALAILLG
jgi:hypothetical protein